MAVPFNKRAKARYGTVATAADTGITLGAGFKIVADEIVDSTGIHKTTLTVKGAGTSKFTFATTNASKGIGQKLYTFPSTLAVPIAAAVWLKSTLTGAAGTAGEVGIGTTVASGAVSVLSGTAGFQDILDGKTLSNHVDGTQLESKKGDAAGGTSGTMAGMDGTGTAKSAYFNIASAFSAVGTFSVDELVVTLMWADLGNPFQTGG